MVLTNGQIAESTIDRRLLLSNDEITSRRQDEQPDAKLVKTYREYAGGEHREVLTTAQQKLLGQRSAHKMTDNILKLILKTTASRLRLTKWDVLGEEPVSIVDGTPVSDSDVQNVTQWLAATWMLNRMQRLQFEVHYATLRDGNSAVSLSWRGGRPRIRRESWWDGESGMFVAYADSGEYEFAVREWGQRERSGTVVVRRTVYEPGLITRWEQDGDGWKQYERDSEPAVIEITRGTADGQRPMPIPVVHFPNGTAVTDGEYGVSDIAELLALQDDLNATQMDITAAALLTAFQRIFISGMAKTEKLALEPGSVFGTDNPGANLTVVDAGDLSQLTDVHGYKRQSMSIDSQTPMHTLTGEWPSGAALLRAEMPLIEKVEALGAVAGPQWTMVAHRAMEMANAFGGLSLNEDVPITSVFAPAERIDELTELEIKRAKADLWEVISRLPKEAMVQAGVEEGTAQLIVDQREGMLGTVAEAF